jgi:hypothetical protein
MGSEDGELIRERTRSIMSPCSPGKRNIEIHSAHTRQVNHIRPWKRSSVHEFSLCSRRY